MATQEEKDAERKQRDAERLQREQKRLRREATIRRIKDIVWSAVIASVITIIVVTALGWLTTQAVVETARQQGAKDLVSLRAAFAQSDFNRDRMQTLSFRNLRHSHMAIETQLSENLSLMKSWQRCKEKTFLRKARSRNAPMQ